MSTPYPPDPANTDDPNAAAPSGPVRYPTGQPSFPYQGTPQRQPGPIQPFAPPSSTAPGYMPSPSSYAPPPSPYPPLPPSYPPPAMPYPPVPPGYLPAAPTMPPPPAFAPPTAPAQQTTYQYGQAVAAPPLIAGGLAGTKHSYVGLIIAALGGAASILAFFALPLIDAGAFGSITAIQLANAYSALYGRFCPGSPGCPSINPVIILWVPVIAGGLAMLVSGTVWLISTQARSKAAPGGSIAVLLLGIVGMGVLAYLVFGSGSSTITQIELSFLGSGFWVMVIGLAGTVIGAIVQLATRS